jgi:hypothetical protein
MQTLAFLCELHRKEIVPDVPIVQSLRYVHRGGRVLLSRSKRSSRSKPHGSSKFKPSRSSKLNVQEFKVILRAGSNSSSRFKRSIGSPDGPDFSHHVVQRVRAPDGCFLLG